MDTMKKVSVFLLSSDRPKLIVETIDSILAQSYKDFELVVSDNSAHDEVEQLMRSRYPQVRYVRRTPRRPALVHFETILNEVDSEFFVLFHDDDIMLPGYLERMVSVMNEQTELAALGCNAWIMRDQQITEKKFVNQLEEQKLFTTPEALVTPYLQILTSVAPFPGYMYRSEKVRGLCLKHHEGGKYADVSFLMKVASRGPVCWLGEPLMKYRFHSGNDSGVESIWQQLRLLRFVYKNTSFNRRSDLVKQYRFAYWTRWLLNRKNWKTDRFFLSKFKTIASFVLGYGTYALITQPVLWKRIITKKIL